MKRLPQLSRPNSANIAGLDLVRLIDVRDIAGVIDPNRFYSVSAKTFLPNGWLVPNVDAVWIEMFFPVGMAQYNASIIVGTQGVSTKHSLLLPLLRDEPACAELMKMLAKGRWLAMVMDGNETVKVIGLPGQPLKVKQGAFTTSGNNAWNVELVTETLHPAFYLSDWDIAILYGNPADYSFDFSLDFNA